MPILAARSLRFQITFVFGLFVVLGSLAIVTWLQRRTNRASLERFAAEARANAAFLREARLPLTDRTADSLARVLGVEFFCRDAAWIPREPNGEGFAAGDQLAAMNEGARTVPRMQVAMAPIGADARLLLRRPLEPNFSAIMVPETLAILAAFWLFAIGLGWALTRRIVEPLRQLTRRLPTIGAEQMGPLPGVERTDEIGELARTFAETSVQLAEERRKREEAERLALLGRMATGLAHEIHNPLSAIRVHAQLLQSATPEEWDEVANESLSPLLDGTVRIESLVNQWMFLARPEPPKTSALRLPELIDRAVKTYAAMARHAGVEIAVNLPERIQVRADERRLTQAVSNLLANAIQAMPDGGTVRIDADLADGATVELRFRDEGPGFSADALARGRELFFSTREGGMGIGLTVTSEILAAHGGSICTGNAPGGGAVVTMRLPLSV